MEPESILKSGTKPCRARAAAAVSASKAERRGPCGMSEENSPKTSQLKSTFKSRRTSHSACLK